MKCQEYPLEKTYLNLSVGEGKYLRENKWDIMFQLFLLSLSCCLANKNFPDLPYIEQGIAEY